MKNVIFRYGIISGLVIASLMLITTLITKATASKAASFEYGMIIGYTNMVLAFSVVYFAMKKYRDSHNNDKLSIREGLLIGLGVTTIATIFYSLMWLFVYYNIIPNFIDEYSAYALDKLMTSGAKEIEIEQHQKGMDSFREMYQTPFSIFLITLIEPLPVGVLVTVISTMFLRKK